MARKLMFELGAGAVERLEVLMERFGEREPEAMISRALGLLESVSPYLDDGVLTVLDPDAPAGGANDAHVDLVFENARSRTSARQSA